MKPLALLLFATIAAAQTASIPERAIPAILAAFDRYEIVGMGAGHGLKDEDDFILALIRTPGFPEKVNDIAVECGNSLYQPLLDRYIAGEDVPFGDVRKVWRNTTQRMCGLSAFYEQFFPLVRAVNRKLPLERRLRVLAGDSPIDWEKPNARQSLGAAQQNRNNTIAAIMQKEVLAKHHKALMLFGVMHLLHNAGASAVSIYEKDYPNRTMVISSFGDFEPSLPAWPAPSLIRAKETWLGALELGKYFPPPVQLGPDCKVHQEFPKEWRKPMEDLVDAFLYLGPLDLKLRKPTPADIALDAAFMAELQDHHPLGSQSIAQWSEQVVRSAQNPVINQSPSQSGMIEAMVKACLERKPRRP